MNLCKYKSPAPYSRQVGDVLSFLVVMNYFQLHVCAHYHLASSLTRLTTARSVPGSKCTWGDLCVQTAAYPVLL